MSTDPPRHASYPISYQVRPYLFFLATQGYARFDWDWLLAVGGLPIWEVLSHVGFDLGRPTLLEEAIGLGYGASNALRWSLTRLFLHTANPHVERLGDTEIAERIEATYRFGERPDVHLFHGSAERYQSIRKQYTAALHLLHIVLYHRLNHAWRPSLPAT